MELQNDKDNQMTGEGVFGGGKTENGSKDR